MTLFGIVLYVLYAVIVLLLAIVVHELTHAFMYWRMTGHKPTFSISMKRFRLESAYNFEDIDDTQYKYVLWGGVIAGGFIVLVTIDTFSFLTWLTILALYIAGCKGDIQRLKALRRTKNG